MITKITIDSITEKLKKDGTPIEGVSSKGNKWKLYRVNNKYDFFHNGEGEPRLEIGEEYEMEETSKTNEYGTTTTINFPRPGGRPSNDGNVMIMDEIIAGFKALNERLDKLIEYIVKNLPKKE